MSGDRAGRGTALDYRGLFEPHIAAPRISGGHLYGRCPFHDDRKSSFSANLETGLWKCHAGCGSGNARQFAERLGLAPPEDARPASRKVLAVYDYVDERGETLYQVLRYAPKDFRQRRPDGAGGWIWNLDGVRRVPYRLREVLASAARGGTVFVVEGEKDADRLAALGLVVTTSPGGAGKWQAEFAAPLRDRHVAILPDADGPGRAHAQQVARALYGTAASVKVIPLPGLPERGDISDWLDGGGTRESLEALVAAAPPWRPSPAPDLAALLDRARAFVLKYLVLLPAQSVAVVLWTAHTFVIEAFDLTPYLAVTSPEKRSGKTRLLEVLELLLPVTLRVANISDAALFRTLADTSQGRVVLLLDEADAMFNPRGDREDLRALLNAGYRRGAVVARCEGEGKRLRVERYDAFGAKAIAAIGVLPDTVADRSIPIRMQRRAAHETVARLRLRDAGGEAAPIREAFAAWATPEVIEALRAARPECPAELDDRAADGWEVLLALADMAGGEWPQRARDAAVALHAGGARGGESFGVRLLADVRRAFDERGAERLETAQLLEALADDETAPWGDWHGRRLSPQGLSRLLRRFDISPAKWRDGVRAGARGYAREAFEEAWSRYLSLPLSPSPSTSEPPQPPQPRQGAGFGDFEEPPQTPFVAVTENGGNAGWERVVADVAVSTPEEGGGTETAGVLEAQSTEVADFGDTGETGVLRRGEGAEARGVLEVPQGFCPRCESPWWWQRTASDPLVCPRCHPPAPGAANIWWVFRHGQWERVVSPTPDGA